MKSKDEGLIVDLFAGGGGASMGIEAAMGRHVDIAINHDPIAIAVHLANHPKTKHYTTDIWDVDPKQACGDRRVRLLHASPDCKHFSRAKGGKPKSKKVRSLAWVVHRWAKAVRPEVITLENVAEFEDWGPLDAEDKAISDRKGETFKRWKRELENLGYVVEHRLLTASHFGAPTSRKRFFLIARCDGLPIAWPTRTHGPGLLPYATAAQCIDWAIPNPSIFERKKPLAEKTLRRVAAGIVRYALESPRPFIVTIDNGSSEAPAQDSNSPLSTVIASNQRHALVTPFIAGCGGRAGQTPPTGGDAPVGTITTKNDRCLVAATLVQTGYGERQGQAPRTLNIEEPLGTVVADGQKHALVLAELKGKASAAFLAKHYGGVVGQELDKPIGTVTAVDHHSLVTAKLETGDHADKISAFLTTYYGSTADVGQSLNDPLRTVVTKDRFGLVTVKLPDGSSRAIADITLRMLEPHELNRAQFGEFAAGYDMTPAKTKKDRVRLTGNSVCPEVERAVIAALFPSEAQRKAA